MNHPFETVTLRLGPFHNHTINVLPSSSEWIMPIVPELTTKAITGEFEPDALQLWRQARYVRSSVWPHTFIYRGENAPIENPIGVGE